MRVRAHAGTQLGLFVGERRAPERARLRLSSTSTTNTLAPARAAATDNAAVTGLPDPALARNDHDGGRAEALEVHGPGCYGLSNSSSRGRSARADRRRNPGLGLGAQAADDARAGAAASTSCRWRAGCSTNRWCATRSSRRTRRATMIAPGEVERRDRCRGRRHRARDRPSQCRWWCGSVRPARMPRERARCCSKPRTLPLCHRRRAGPRTRCGWTTPMPSERQVANQLAALAERRGRDPEGARKLADTPRFARGSCGRGDRRRAADDRGAHRAPRRHHGRDRGRRGGAVDREGGRRGAPPSAAEPGGAVHPARPRRSGAPPVDQPVDRVLPVRRGLALLVFEFYTASIGLAGLVGASAVSARSSGSPTTGELVGLRTARRRCPGLRDRRAGGLARFWTMVGAIGLAVGSLFIYGGSAELGPPWWVLLVVSLGMLLFMLGGMTAMIRPVLDPDGRS